MEAAPREFGSISLAPPAPTPQRTHHELPRLQIPPLALIQPQPPQQPQLHWKAAAVEPPQPPVSRMRMVANFFSSEARQQQQQQLQAPPPSGGVLPSFSEILARTKQLYINPNASAEVVTVAPADHEMEEAEQVIEQQQQQQQASLQPNYAAARYALQPPAPIDVSYSMDEYDDHGMDTPASPSGSMSPMSQSGKLSKRRERWTEDEHARFMEGLNRYGRKWKKIQAFVKTKTAVQVRTHAYGYFAKLLRNMPEDDAAWELAEEMSSLPGAVLKGPSSGKRRSEPKTDEAGMDILRRFVFSKKKTDAPAKSELASSSVALETSETAQQIAPIPQQMWGSQEGWNLMESEASSVMLDLKRQRIN